MSTASTAPASDRGRSVTGFMRERRRGPVLLATDGVGPGDDALRVAHRLAAQLGVDLQPVAVARTTAAYPAWSALPIAMSAYEAGLMSELRASVVRRIGEVLDPTVAARVDVRGGVPADAINKQATAAGASLIVVGRGPQGIMQRLTSEDIAHHVIRGASVPVLAIDDAAGTSIRHVVVGMDFGAASIRAAQTALELVDRSEPSAVIVSLVHADPRLAAGDGVSDAERAGYRSRVGGMFARARALLAPFVPAGATIETRTSGAAPFEALLDTAVELEADLLAVGTRGAGWLDRLLLGSVATTVLRHGRRSVLVAPPPTPVERVRLELQVTGRVTFEADEDWRAALDAFTRRNAKRLARLEAVGDGINGLGVVSTGARFLGAAYDAEDERVQVMLDTAGGAHLTHTVTRVHSVTIASAHAGHDLSLAIEHDAGELVLVFTP